ncbi:MAG: hypothetical protein KDI92_10750 [Xanthomonadales bacterium]|nr:hypothetical protein [Xanthomonadales bacterium]
MNMSVACLLEGRDLALVKSIININNISGIHNLTYVDRVESCHLLIAKTKVNDEIVYFAVDRFSKKKYRIKPKLTPRSIRDMFEHMTKAAAIA